MGYTTEFEGELKFTTELKASEILKLQTISGENPDDHKDWQQFPPDKLSYIQYELTKDFSGLKWDGGEKFYYAVEALNFIIRNMRLSNPDFGLTGYLRAQGEELGDIWEIHIGADGIAYRKELPKPDDIIECPHCAEQFRLGDVK